MLKTIRKLKKETKTKIYTSCFVDLNRDIKNTIFLAGVSRSGTTWVSDVINYDNEYRYIFEPFRPQDVKPFSKFNNIQYIHPDTTDAWVYESVHDTLSGKLRSSWSDKLNKKLIANKRFIKATRANLMLKWLHENFSQVPLILLFRHPCAVANSKIRLEKQTQGGRWTGNLQIFLKQDDLIKDYLNPFIDDIHKAYLRQQETKDDFETHIFQWCIQNYVPLKQFKPGEVHLAFYEDLCISPNTEIPKLFSFIGKTYDSSVLSSLNKASSVSREDSAVNTGESLIMGWQKFITSQQIDRALEIMSLFGLDGIYSAEPQPNAAKAQQLLQA